MPARGCGFATWFVTMWSFAAIDPAALTDTVARVAFVLFIASFTGRACSSFRLPKISGYLLTGALLGPAVLTSTHTALVAVTDTVCLAVIGVAAGSELKLGELRKQPRPTIVMTTCVSLFSFTFVFLGFLVIGPRVGFLVNLNTEHVVVIASLLGTLAIARSPASAIAVLKEMDGKGPFCQHVMAVTVVKDALVVVLFALNLEFVALAGLDFERNSYANGSDGSSAQLGTSLTTTGTTGTASTTGTTDTASLLGALCKPLVSVVLAFFFGAAFGAALSVAVRPRFLFFSGTGGGVGSGDASTTIDTVGKNPKPQNLNPKAVGTVTTGNGSSTGTASSVGTASDTFSTVTRTVSNTPPSFRNTLPVAKRVTRACVVAFLASTAFAVADSVGVEPLLLCVVAGATCANAHRFNKKNWQAERAALGGVVSTLMPVVNLVFFTVVGATIRFDKVLSDPPLMFAAVTVFAARVFALFHATTFAKDVLVGTAGERKGSNGYGGNNTGSNTGTGSTSYNPLPSFFSDRKTTDVLYLAMITQAGVAMGLVKQCERRFPGWGSDFAPLAAATIVLNLIVGPVAFRNAIVAAGESGVVSRGGKDTGTSSTENADEV